MHVHLFLGLLAWLQTIRSVLNDDSENVIKIVLLYLVFGGKGNAKNPTTPFSTAGKQL
jgi:hypothetical protein